MNLLSRVCQQLDLMHVTWSADPYVADGFTCAVAVRPVATGVPHCLFIGPLGEWVHHWCRLSRTYLPSKAHLRNRSWSLLWYLQACLCEYVHH